DDRGDLVNRGSTGAERTEDGELVAVAACDLEEHVRGVLSDLKQLGVMIALDDFGTGYSSLAYLKRFPVDTLKIDRLFIDDIDCSDEANAVVGSIIALAHRLQLNVVAEGIETVAQYRVIAELSCDQCQGYFFARPMSGDAFFELMVTSSGIGRAGIATTNGTNREHPWQPATVGRSDPSAMTPRA
ncbi:MAG: EAL domain-containing protein, partial [Microthrixaceae bacterium]